MPSTRSKAGGGGCGCGAAVAVLRAGVVAEVDNACGGHGGLEEEVVSESDTLMCVCRLLAQRRDWSPTHGRALRGRHSAAPHGGRACHPKQSLLVPCHKHQLPTRLPPPSPPQASRANAAQIFVMQFAIVLQSSMSTRSSSIFAQALRTFLTTSSTTPAPRTAHAAPHPHLLPPALTTYHVGLGRNNQSPPSKETRGK